MEKSKINFEEVSFGIIGKVGEAKFKALEAFKKARVAKKAADLKPIYEEIEEAKKLVNEAGSLHMDVITEEANGIQHDFKVLFMHAEDQFLTVQTFVQTIELMVNMIEDKVNAK